MPVLYTQDQKKQVRVTLTLSVLSDFNARQIDWRKKTVSLYSDIIDPFTNNVKCYYV